MSETSLSPIESALVAGDLSKLSEEQRVQYYLARCEAANLDPRSQPFDYIKRDGRLRLYANASAADQIAARRSLNIDILSREMTEGDIYEVVVRVRETGGRSTENVSCLYVGNLRGEALADARMKNVTKGRRRTILAHCGLGSLDEGEAEPLAGTVQVEAAPAAPPVVHDLAYWRRYAMALYTELGGDTEDRDRCRADIAKDLAIDPKSRKELTAEQWEQWAKNLRRQKEVEGTLALGEHEPGTPAQAMGY
jgi:hypothetical protein